MAKALTKLPLPPPALARLMLEKDAMSGPAALQVGEERARRMS
jgi:hypothetical protein